MSEQKKTVLVDMDGVMADFDSAALVSLPKNLIVPRSQFYVAHDYPENLRSTIEDTYNAPDFFENLQPMPGLLEGWQAMLDNGYRPRIASAPLSSNRNSIEGKIKWLDKIMTPEFGVSVIENAIINKKKWSYRGLAIIDDNPVIQKGPDGTNTAEWEHILFGWSHLPTVPLSTTAFRLLSWRDTDQLITMLDTIKERRSS